MTFSSKRRVLLAGLGSLALSACSARSALERTYYREAADAYPWTRAEVESLPYAQMCARFGKHPRAALVLSSAEEGLHHWVSADQITLVLQRARVVETRGLDRDLLRTAFNGRDPLADYVPGGAGMDGSRAQRLLDLRTPELTYRNVGVDSRFHVEGPETVDILGRSYDTLRLREDFVSEDLQWSGANRYWMSLRNPMAWKSVQHLAPGLEPLTLEVLKRAA